MISADDKRLYTIPETAQVLGIGRTTVYDLLASGQLKRVKVGTRALIHADCIDEFVARLMAEQHPETIAELPAAA
ncbi:excisionase [Actinotalea ferrariae CF5-4]|uniref:Excisionase n=2 Tax=Actinotalea TaxID=458839 RepID=A0A021W0M6_9CELL|nr:excisionase [Actinotalea ferrariae CF5-4]